MTALQISALSVDHSSPYWIWYHTRRPVLAAGVDRVYGAQADDADWKVVRWKVVAWAARGDVLWPVRLEDRTGRGVLCGSSSDPLQRDFIAVTVAGTGLEALGEEVDLVIRARHQGAEVEFWHAAA